MRIAVYSSGARTGKEVVLVLAKVAWAGLPIVSTCASFMSRRIPRDSGTGAPAAVRRKFDRSWVPGVDLVALRITFKTI